MIVLELIYNLSLLVALSVLSGFIDLRFKRNTFTGQILQGILFGITAVIGMMFPFVLQEGMIFDGRSIVISLCTLFFGPLSGSIASLGAIGYRLHLGGDGVIMGTLVIVSSFIVGYLFHYKKIKDRSRKISNLRLYLFGLVVHIVMLLMVLTLPQNLILTTYENITFTVIVVYPVMTLIIGKILLDQEKNQELIGDLKRSESIFRKLAESSPSAIFIYQGDQFVYVNPATCELTGYTESELIGSAIWRVIHPDHREMVKERARERLEGKQVQERYHFKVIRKDGEARWLDSSTTLIEFDGKPAGLGSAYEITSLINSLETVQQQKELFQTTIYSIGDAVITTDLDGKILQMNHVAENLTGWKEKETVGLKLGKVFKIINEITRNEVESPVERVLESGEIIGLANHTLLVSKNGDETPIADSGAPIKNKDGSIIGVVLVFRDQTEERAAAKKLVESEEKFRSLVNSAFDGIYLMEDKYYTFVNDKFCEMTGYSREELTSESFDVNILLTEKGKRIVWERYKARKRGEEIPATYEFQIQSKQGEVKDVEISTVSIGNPNRISIIGIMRDITERKIASQEIRKAKERMQVLIEGTPHLFFYVQDVDKLIEYISPSVEKITGHSVDEWLGQKHWFMTDHPMNKEVRDRTFDHMKGELNDDPIVGEIYHKDGRKLMLEVYEKPIIRDGKVVGLQGVAHDITEKRKAEIELREAKERAERSDKLKSEFLAQVSHEIRSPLNAVINFTSLIKEETKRIVSDELDISFAGIDSASRRVIRTIDLIINMSELQLGTYQISTREIDLIEMLSLLKTEYNSLAKSKGLNLEFLHNSGKAIVKTDEYAANQIFANLIDNAIKYTKQGFVKVEVYNENGSCSVKISDSGMGMSPQYIAEIFEPFTQEEQGYSRRFEGSGLGMSLVKKYSELINVDISVESEKERGTEFTIKFPAS